MDFKALREQILANVENFDANETKIVVTKLLDFLVDINDKRSQLEIENKQLFEDMNKNTHDSGEHKAKIDEIFEKANIEAKSIIENAQEIANQKITEAETSSKELVQQKRAEIEAQTKDIINQTINKLEKVVTEITRLDQETKLYRSHILSIFKKTIFKFSDTNYYLIRKDDKDFNDLLKFFEVDSRIQTFADENIKKLNSIKNFIEIRDSVKNKVNDSNIIHTLEEILQGNEINFEENKEITEEEIDQIKQSNKEEKNEKIIEVKEPVEEVVKETDKSSKKFIDLLSKYNNK